MKRLFSRMAARSWRLAKDQSGATALMLGLAVIPLFMAAGAAVD